MVYQGLMRMRLRFRRMQTVDLEHEHPHDHIAGHTHDHPEIDPIEETAKPVATAVQHTHPHVHRGALPAEDYGSKVTFVIGMFHGVGAETPTQVVLLLTAAGIGSRVTGAAVLLAFIAGLLVTNTLIAAVASLGYLRAGKNFALYAALGVVAALFSIILGTLILIGSDDALPTLFG